MNYMYLPKGLKLKYKGELKWMGKQGRLEIIYDEVDEVWRGFMTVKLEEPPPKGGNKPLYIDLGVINLATVWFDGLKAAHGLLRQGSPGGLVVLDKTDS
jgi:transposase